MRMATRRTRDDRGVSLLEVMISMVVITVASIGALSYEYHGVRQMRVARATASAVRIGYLLLEEWKANGGSASYARNSGPYSPDNPDCPDCPASPENLNLGLVLVSDWHETANGVNMSVFEYEVTIEGRPMKVRLSRPIEYRNLIPLTASITWGDMSNPVILYAQARVDQAGG